MYQTIGRSRSTMPRRESESAREPIGRDKKLVEKDSARISSEGPRGELACNGRRER